MINKAFKLDCFLQLQGGWKTLEIDKNIPLSVQKLCPADQEELQTLVTLVGNSGQQRLRYGYCARCGYTGYIDRPTKEWINAFYLDMWKVSESELITDSEIQKRRAEFADHFSRLKETSNLGKILRKLSPDKDRFICEIGTGGGDELKLIQELGYPNVLGIENSRRRATITERAHGLKVFAGAFESPDVQEEIKKRGDLSVIFSRHVMEHVYDPQEVIQCGERLQSEGDYLIIILPNGESEAAMTSLFFLPHLHSFTVAGLTDLMRRHHYDEIDTSFSTDNEICLVGRKKSSVAQNPPPNTRPRNDTLRRFLQGMSLSRGLRSVRRLIWEKNFGDARRLFFFKDLPYMDNLYFRLRLKINRWIYPKSEQKIHACLVSPVSKRFTVQEESPIEVQFEGNIALLYK